MLLLERSKITVSGRHFFKKKVCYGSFGLVSTLRKKIFSVARMKCFSHCGSNNSNSAVFGNAILGETKDHNLRTTPFPKRISMEVSSLCLPYVKRYFQEHQLSESFFMAQITQTLLFSVIRTLKRSRIAVWELHLFKKKSCYGSFGFVSTLRKNVFSGAPVKWLSLCDSNKSDSVLFGNADFAEIKDQSLSTMDF